MSPAIELALQWALYMGLWLSLLRWPGRTFGLGLALVLWTVWGPWATWLTLAVVVVCAVWWKRSGRDAGVGLLAYPQWAAIVLGAAFALLGRGVASTAGFVVMAAVAAWMLGSRFTLLRQSRLPAVVDGSAGTSSAEWPPAGRRFLGRGSWIVDFAPCDGCGSLMVASGRLESDPSVVVARSVCTGCGVRMVGMEDPGSPGHLVWWQDLTPEAREDIA